MELGDLLGNPESRYGEVFRIEILSRVIQMSSLESAHMAARTDMLQLDVSRGVVAADGLSMFLGVRDATRHNSPRLT